jgi:hypothetical protein
MKKILFLHHSTGELIWRGKTNKYIYKFTTLGDIQKLFSRYNKDHSKDYSITEQSFPKRSPYGWKNYPYDYYNIWVKNAGDKSFKEEPTLEILTREYDVIILKHCFPVCNIQADKDSSVGSDYKSISNFKLQYKALKDKMHQFPETKFIVWTGAAQLKSEVTEEEAKRAREFFSWVCNEWDTPGDNIFIWDFYNLQTEGNLYFSKKYSAGFGDSHPNSKFSGYAARLFFNRIIDVLETDGLKTTLKGEPI